MANSKKEVAIATKSIQTAKVTYVKLEDIFEPVGLNGGDIDVTRWDLDIPKVRKAYDELVDSILSNGFIAGIVAIELSVDVILYDIVYKVGSWLAVDVNGRVLVLKDLYEQGFVLNRNHLKLEGKVPVVDVTNLVIPDETKKIDEDIIEKLWETLVKLNTGQLQWTDYDFISTGSRAITNPDQKPIWEYLTHQLKKYHQKDLSNKVVLAATIKSLTDKMKRESHIPYDMRLERYSELILELLVDMRKEHGSKYCKAPYMTLLARYLRNASITGVFKGWLYDIDGNVDETTITDCFKVSSDLYDDSNYFEFSKYLEFIKTMLVNQIAAQEGFPGGTVKFNITMHEFIYKASNKYYRRERTK